MKPAICLFAVALLLAAATLAAQEQQEQPPVAEAALQTREAQKQASRAAKLYTNENLPHRSGGISVVGAATAQAPATTPSAENGQRSAEMKKSAAVEEKGPAYWHQRFAEARAKLSEAESELAAAERELSRLQLEYYSDPNKALDQQYSRSDIHKQETRIAAKQKEVDELRRQLSELKDEERRAGGDPGWAR